MPNVSPSQPNKTNTFQDSLIPANLIHLEKNRSIADGLPAFVAKQAISNIRNNFKQNVGWATESDCFNSQFGGIDNVCAIAAETGHGKTRLARSLCLDFLNADAFNAVLYLSGEEDETAIEKNVVSGILNINTSLWSEPLSKEGQFSVYYAKKVNELYQTKNEEQKNLFIEYNSLLNRFKVKTRGDNVFENKESFQRAIASAVANSIIGDKPLNELLVVIDHLGEFDLDNGTSDSDYNRTNSVLKLVMDAVSQENGEYITDFKTMLSSEVEKGKILENVYNQVYDNMLDFMDSNQIHYTKEELKEKIYFTKIRFLILCQLKNDAVSEFGRNTVKQWKWSASTLGGSTKIGQKMLQVLFVWNLQGFNNYDLLNSKEIQQKNEVCGTWNMGMLKVSKNRNGKSNKILPYLFNTGSQRIVIPPCAKLIDADGYENWLEENSFAEKPKKWGADKGDENQTNEKIDAMRSMTKYLSSIQSNPNINGWVSSWKEKENDRKRFYNLFAIEDLVPQITIKNK